MQHSTFMATDYYITENHYVEFAKHVHRQVIVHQIAHLSHQETQLICLVASYRQTIKFVIAQRDTDAPHPHCSIPICWKLIHTSPQLLLLSPQPQETAVTSPQLHPCKSLVPAYSTSSVRCYLHQRHVCDIWSWSAEFQWYVSSLWHRRGRLWWARLRCRRQTGFGIWLSWRRTRRARWLDFRRWWRSVCADSVVIAVGDARVAITCDACLLIITQALHCLVQKQVFLLSQTAALPAF